MLKSRTFRRVGLTMCLGFPLALLLGFALLILASCNDEKKDRPGTPSPSPAVGKLAEGMQKPLDTIKTESRAAVKKAPEVAPHTDAIDAAAGDLATIQAQLRAAQLTIAANDQTYRDLEAALTKERDEAQKKAAGLEKDLAKAREEKNGMLSWGLRALVGLGVVGVPVCLFLFKHGPLALTCAGVAATALVCDVVLDVVYEYRLWITGGLGAVFLGAVLWLIIDNWKDLRALVGTAEKYKKSLDADVREFVNGEVAKVQPKRTQKLVKHLRTEMKLTDPARPSLWARFLNWFRSRRKSSTPPPTS